MSIHRGIHLRDRRRDRKLNGRCSECGRRCEDGNLCSRCAKLQPELGPVTDELPEPNAKSIEMHRNLDHYEKRELARLALLRLQYLPMGDDDLDPFDDAIYRRLMFWCASRLTESAEGVAIAEEVWADAQDAFTENEDGFRWRVRQSEWLIEAYNDPHFRAMSTMI